MKQTDSTPTKAVRDLKIKVCGMRKSDNIQAVEALDIDLMGFIFWPKSSRYVEQVPDYLPTRCQRVGVFVNSEIDDVLRHVTGYQLDAVQLHGTESPAYINSLRSAWTRSKHQVQIIKAISVSSSNDIVAYKDYEGLVDYFLFDTKCPSVGGSGCQFDWSVLAQYDGSIPFLLSGGIGPNDTAQVHAFHHPKLAGIDLNSLFEISPALKDINKLKQFLQKL